MTVTRVPGSPPNVQTRQAPAEAPATASPEATAVVPPLATGLVGIHATDALAALPLALQQVLNQSAPQATEPPKPPSQEEASAVLADWRAMSKDITQTKPDGRVAAFMEINMPQFEQLRAPVALLAQDRMGELQQDSDSRAAASEDFRRDDTIALRIMTGLGQQVTTATLTAAGASHVLTSARDLAERLQPFFHETVRSRLGRNSSASTSAAASTAPAELTRASDGQADTLSRAAREGQQHLRAAHEDIQIPGPEVLEIEQHMKSNLSSIFGSDLQIDLESYIWVVMMECSKSAQDDLKAVLADMKKLNAQKAQVRDHVAKMKEQQEAVKADLRRRYDERVRSEGDDKIDPNQMSFEEYCQAQQIDVMQGSLSGQGADGMPPDPSTPEGRLVLRRSPNETYYDQPPPEVRVGDDTLTQLEADQATMLNLEPATYMQLRERYEEDPALQAQFGAFEEFLTSAGGVGLTVNSATSQTAAAGEWLSANPAPEPAATTATNSTTDTEETAESSETERVSFTELGTTYHLSAADTARLEAAYNALPASWREEISAEDFCAEQPPKGAGLSVTMSGTENSRRLTAFLAQLRNIATSATESPYQPYVIGPEREEVTQADALQMIRDSVPKASDNVPSYTGPERRAREVVDEAFKRIPADLQPGLEQMLKGMIWLKLLKAGGGASLTQEQEQALRVGMQLYIQQATTDPNVRQLMLNYVNLRTAEAQRDLKYAGECNAPMRSDSWLVPDVVFNPGWGHGTNHVGGLGSDKRAYWQNEFLNDLQELGSGAQASRRPDDMFIAYNIVMTLGPIGWVIGEIAAAFNNQFMDGNRFTQSANGVGELMADSGGASGDSWFADFVPTGVPAMSEAERQAFLSALDAPPPPPPTTTETTETTETTPTTTGDEQGATTETHQASVTAEGEQLRAGIDHSVRQPDRIEGLKEMTLGQLASVIESWESKKDTMSDLSQEMSLKIQLYQERLSKFMSTLTNMMKKMSETSSGIVNNLKS